MNLHDTSSSDYSYTDDEVLKSNNEFDSNESISEQSHDDYEEEERKYTRFYRYDPILIKCPIDVDIKNIISRKISKIDIRDLNYALLVSSMIILIKSGNKINDHFSSLCDEVIEMLLKYELNICGRSESVYKLDREIVNQLKRDLLRYCRFIQLCTE
jgi:hypothetical protein